jgi:hypothetical protein
MKQDCAVYGGFAFSSMRLRQTTKIPFVPLQYNMANKNTVLLSLQKKHVIREINTICSFMYKEIKEVAIIYHQKESRNKVLL